MQETRKRILQVVYSFGVGGSEMVALDIALGLQGRGIANAVCALEYGGPLREELSRAGVPSFVVGRQGGGILGTLYRMLRIMLRFKPDVVHTHHLYELFYAWPAALACGARIVHTEHERFSLEPGNKRMLLRILSRTCAVVTAVDEDVAAFLREKVRIPGERVALIPNGVNVERLGNAPSVRESLGIAPDRPVLGIVARLEAEKDHQTLLHAFASTIKSVPSALLLVIGDGSLRHDLEHLAEQLAIQDNVVFLGMRRDIPELMNSLDLAVLSSRAEGLPLCILEAMAAGKAVVTTRVGGLPNVVRDGETGLLVPPGNAQALADAIVRLLADAPLRKRFGELGRQIVASQYSTRQSLDRYVRLYSAQHPEPGVQPCAASGD